MSLLDHLEECIEKPYCDIISSIVVIAIAWEVALNLVVNSDASLISDNLNLCILNS